MIDRWKTTTLGETCKMYQPKTISGKEMVEAGAYPVFGANGIIGRYDKFNHEESQLLITCRGATCGSVNISDPESWITGNAMVVRPMNGEISMRFLEYLFRGGIDISKAITGAAQPQITRTNLAPLGISYPVSLPEQERIVAILDEAFEGIATATAHARRNLHNARELFQSVLQSTFEHPGEDWVEKRVGEIADHCLGKMLDKRKNRGTPKPYLRNKNVRWFSFDLDDVLEMKFEDDEADRYTAKRGDVMICEGGYPGRAAIWESDEPIYFQKAIHRVRFHETVFNKWFVYLLHHQDSTGALKDHFTGAGIQHFTGKALALFPVPVGPTPVVKSLVQKLDALAAETRRLESVYQRKLDALTELKQSLLQRAFAGEL